MNVYGNDNIFIIIFGSGYFNLFQFARNSREIIKRDYYCANEERQSRDILFTDAEYIVQYYP